MSHTDFSVDAAIEASAEFLEELEPMIDMVTGYKAKWLAAGFSPEVAEEMCLQMHRKIVESQTWDY